MAGAGRQAQGAIKAHFSAIVGLQRGAGFTVARAAQKSLANGVDDVEFVSAYDARRFEPELSSEVVGGLLIPRESIIDPFTTTIAFADVALANGVDFLFGAMISDVTVREGLKSIDTAGDLKIPARFVINACGLGSRRLVDAYGGAPMTLNPRRGQFLVYDKQSSHLVNRILLPIPSKLTKGMLVAPTIYGNLLAGPTAEELPADRVDAAETTADGLAAVRASTVQMCPALADQPVIAAYAGLRCNCAEGSYWMRFNDGVPGIVTLSGIRSTGLTASISIAHYVAEQMAEHCGLELLKNASTVNERPESRWPGWWRRPFDDPVRTAERPDYGSIVCTCENISRGEIHDALELCSGIATLDGLKRRTRVLTGRCQGFNCCVPTAEIISRHFAVPLESVTKRGAGSEFIAGQTSLPKTSPHLPNPMQPRTKKRYRVIIIGGGPAGVGTAVALDRAGVENVLLIEPTPKSEACPPCTGPSAAILRHSFFRDEAESSPAETWRIRLRRELARTRTDVWLESQVIDVDGASSSIALRRAR